jgi:hypothetical protein
VTVAVSVVCAIACGLFPIACGLCPAIAVGAGAVVIDEITSIDADSLEKRRLRRIRPLHRHEADDRRIIVLRREAGEVHAARGARRRAPRPQIPAPLEWGRGPQTKHNTAGFNLAVAKVSGQPAGCEIFYEIQLRFIDPGTAALPPSKIVTMVFSGGEDLLTDPRRAVFGLPMNVAISPARTEAREAFARQYGRATWRVRAVNGSNRTSAWSSFVTQGPASSGVQG